MGCKPLIDVEKPWFFYRKMIYHPTSMLVAQRVTSEHMWIQPTEMGVEITWLPKITMGQIFHSNEPDCRRLVEPSNIGICHDLTDFWPETNYKCWEYWKNMEKELPHEGPFWRSMAYQIMFWSFLHERNARTWAKQLQANNSPPDLLLRSSHWRNPRSHSRWQERSWWWAWHLYQVRNSGWYIYTWQYHVSKNNLPSGYD